MSGDYFYGDLWLHKAHGYRCWSGGVRVLELVRIVLGLGHELVLGLVLVLVLVHDEELVIGYEPL